MNIEENNWTPVPLVFALDALIVTNRKSKVASLILWAVALRVFTTAAIIQCLLWSVNANADGNTTKWKEEVLLHDGNIILVDRWTKVDPSGMREVGQPAPRTEMGTRFMIPGTNQTVTWMSDFGRQIQDNLELILLGFVGKTPYIVAGTGFCHAYNKWGRPNPPYVFFKYEGNLWQRISVAELPVEFVKANVLVSGYNEHQLRGGEHGAPFISVETIKRLNGYLSPYLRTIAREPIKTPLTQSCGELIYYKGAWISSKGTFGRDFVDQVTK